MTTEKILFVDDEPNILQSIQRQLRNRFTLQTAGSGDEALRILKEEGPFSVIVSDMRMPGMNGVELLSKVKDSYPETVRLMLTGNADQETAMEAVNDGQIFRFLTKPCPQATFITSLALALRQHRLIIAEKELLQKTLMGSVTVLSELLAVANPLAFSAGLRCKDYVVNIAKVLNLPNLWQYEIAAMMSQIGCVTLPGDILNKIYNGLELTAEEKEMYENHPVIGASLLEKIPRLENVTKMIRLQLKPFDEYTDEIASSEFEEILVGGQVLKAALDFDRLMFRGMGRQAAIELMRDQKKVYNNEMLEAISGLKIERREQQELSLLVNQISLGMVATKDVMAKNGVLIIPKGQTITLPLLQGLKNFSQQVGVVEPIGVMVGQAEEIPNAA
ncbi:HD domain-containing phosphohydrolase [uncultured Desulfobulbus sp.]|uniref:HD domain-containing phosphohydrolase n=1 Tax=uncultured Desulfobulbus sp. TaxID=239745 RepID=UPI0029C811EE|nr:HD domain-containing phosphohydrolase [uncultured Desulfobulbus sp.]